MARRSERECDMRGKQEQTIQGLAGLGERCRFFSKSDEKPLGL